ncbi:hypothetical protein ES707_17973 [subsurface metagenome]
MMSKWAWCKNCEKEVEYWWSYVWKKYVHWCPVTDNEIVLKEGG